MKPVNSEPAGDKGSPWARRRIGFRTLVEWPYLGRDRTDLPLASTRMSTAFRVFQIVFLGAILALLIYKVKTATHAEGDAAEKWANDKVASSLYTFDLQKAEHGNATDQKYVARMYATGNGFAKDPVKAAYWYRRAADQGDVQAQVILAKMYLAGDGVPKDAAAAEQWYEKAAASGDAYSQSMVGWMHEVGEGVSKDMASAVQWYERAAKHGNRFAEERLGVIYSAGAKGVAPDSARAHEWYQRAAAQGSETARQWLAAHEAR